MSTRSESIQRAVIACLLCLAAFLSVALASVIIGKRSIFDGDINAREKMCDEMTDDEVVRKAEFLLSIMSAHKLSDNEWEIVKRATLLEPPRHWESDSLDANSLRREFTAWTSRTGPVVPEVRESVEEWFKNDAKEIDETLTNKYTGARYRACGTKYSNGVVLDIKFLGNTNW